MNTNVIQLIRKINYLFSEIDSLYHLVSVKLDISDSISSILYTIYEEGDECLLSHVYKKSGISKQTVNSAIRKLEKENILYLEKHSGKSKKIILTDKGKEYIKQTAALLYQAEIDAFSSWDDDDIYMYIHLLEKYKDSFAKQINNL